MRYLFYFGLAVAACRWWMATDRKRKERVRVLPIVAAAFWGRVFLFLWPWESAPVIVGIAPLVIAAVARPGHQPVDARSGPAADPVALATPSAAGVCLVVVNEDARGCDVSIPAPDTRDCGRSFGRVPCARSNPGGRGAPNRMQHASRPNRWL